MCCVTVWHFCHIASCCSDVLGRLWLGCFTPAVFVLQGCTWRVSDPISDAQLPEGTLLSSVCIRAAQLALRLHTASLGKLFGDLEASRPFFDSTHSSQAARINDSVSVMSMHVSDNALVMQLHLLTNALTAEGVLQAVAFMIQAVKSGRPAADAGQRSLCADTLQAVTPHSSKRLPHVFDDEAVLVFEGLQKAGGSGSVYNVNLVQ